MNMLFPSQNESEIRTLLMDLFAFQDVGPLRMVHGGYMSQNFKVETDRGPFFLKQYRNRLNTVIHEIKTAEQFFADKGLPIILPTKDRYKRETFWIGGHWYSLFPFVEGSSPDGARMNHSQIISMAHMLARFHKAGHQFTYRPFQLLRVGNARKFHMENVELLRLLDARKPLSPLDEAILELLTFKQHMVEQTTAIPMDFGISFDCLIHGDYQYNNLFLDQSGNVTHVYDLERASLGHTSYEVARSAIINCFDGGWTDAQYALAQTHVAAYRELHPLSFEEYERAIHFYALNVIFTTWIEARYLIYGMHTQLAIFDRHVKRVKFFSTTNLSEFARRTFA